MTTLGEKLALLRSSYTTADVADAMSKRLHLRDFSLVDFPPLRSGGAFAGRALTLNYRPSGRNDTAVPIYETIERHCVDESFVVMAGLGPSYIYGGNVICRYLRHFGAVGVLTDGRMRDIVELHALDMAICCAGPGTYIPNFANDVHSVGDDIVLSGTTIRNGDVIFGDEDGIVVIPGDRLDEAMSHASDIAGIERQYDELFDTAKRREPLASKLRDVGRKK
jgi:regulator of RNase E activity RraA